MHLFVWQVHNYEKGTDYYKSLNLEVCDPILNKRKLVKPVYMVFEEEQTVGTDEDHDDRLEVCGNEIDEEVVSFHNNHITSFIRSISSYLVPNSKRRLFNEGDF